MELIDTHCHIQSAGLKIGERSTCQMWAKAGDITVDAIVARAQEAGVRTMICVGCDPEDSELAVACVQERAGLYASIGIHPHEAGRFADDTADLERFADLAGQPKVVAMGECGLDFFYDHSSRTDQINILEYQLDLAVGHKLPVIFHVREAFKDFWPVVGNFKGIRGVLHSYTDNIANMEQGVSRGLYVGVNGIATFTKNDDQLAVYRAIPLENLLLETDAPFLTPVPYRGTICEPKHIVQTARFIADLRGDTVAGIAHATAHNAKTLFNL